MYIYHICIYGCMYIDKYIRKYIHISAHIHFIIAITDQYLYTRTHAHICI